MLPKCVRSVSTTSLQQLIHEALWVEGLKVFNLFTEADEAGGDAEFLLDGDEDAAFAAAVEFGDDEPGQGNGFVKLACLLQRVGACGGIDDEDDLMR